MLPYTCLVALAKGIYAEQTEENAIQEKRRQRRRAYGGLRCNWRDERRVRESHEAVDVRLR